MIISRFLFFHLYFLLCTTVLFWESYSSHTEFEVNYRCVMCKVTAWCKWLYSLPFLSSKLPWFINKNKKFKNAFYSHLATLLTDISTLNFMIIVTRRVSNAKIYLLPHPVRDGRCARETRLVTEYILILSKFSSLGCGASGVVFVCLCVCLCITWLLYAFFLLFCWRGSDKTYDFVCGIVNRRG